MEASAFRIDVVNMCLWRRNSAGVDERIDLAPKTRSSKLPIADLKSFGCARMCVLGGVAMSMRVAARQFKMGTGV
jgi:hypothetical protein